MTAQIQPGKLDGYVVRMISADATNLYEVAIRCVIVIACGLALFNATGEWIMLIWPAVYVPATMFYVVCLRRYRAPISALAYWALLALHVFIVLWFSFMPVYVASLGTPAYLFVGGCGVCGLALHNITRRATTPHVAWSDIGSVMIASSLVAVHYMLASRDLAMSIAIAVTIVSINGYFLHTFLDLKRLRQKIDRQKERELETQKMRAVGQVTAGLAHDFNNILTVIRGNLDLHDALRDPQERRATLQEARQAADRAAELVAHLLAFSRKSKISPRPLDLGETLEGFASMARRVLPANVQLDMPGPRPDMPALADASLLNSALLNAAVNARDAMGEEGGTLTITAHAHQSPPWEEARHLGQGPFVEIRICDTGTGVPQDMLERIKDPFYTSKPVGQGSGLGLSMIEGFAAQSGGVLHLRNIPEGGLQVSILLPGSPEQAPAP